MNNVTRRTAEGLAALLIMLVLVGYSIWSELLADGRMLK